MPSGRGGLNPVFEGRLDSQSIPTVGKGGAPCPWTGWATLAVREPGYLAHWCGARIRQMNSSGASWVMLSEAKHLDPDQGWRRFFAALRMT